MFLPLLQQKDVALNPCSCFRIHSKEAFLAMSFPAWNINELTVWNPKSFLSQELCDHVRYGLSTFDYSC